MPCIACVYITRPSMVPKSMKTEKGSENYPIGWANYIIQLKGVVFQAFVASENNVFYILSVG